jgi:hypothetical protein
MQPSSMMSKPRHSESIMGHEGGHSYIRKIEDTTEPNSLNSPSFEEKNIPHYADAEDYILYLPDDSLNDHDAQPEELVVDTMADEISDKYFKHPSKTSPMSITNEKLSKQNPQFTSPQLDLQSQARTQFSQQKYDRRLQQQEANDSARRQAVIQQIQQQLQNPSLNKQQRDRLNRKLQRLMAYEKEYQMRAASDVIPADADDRKYHTARTIQFKREHFGRSFDLQKLESKLKQLESEFRTFSKDGLEYEINNIKEEIRKYQIKLEQDPYDEELKLYISECKRVLVLMEKELNKFSPEAIKKAKADEFNKFKSELETLPIEELQRRLKNYKQNLDFYQQMLEEDPNNNKHLVPIISEGKKQMALIEKAIRERTKSVTPKKRTGTKVTETRSDSKKPITKKEDKTSTPKTSEKKTPEKKAEPAPKKTAPAKTEKPAPKESSKKSEEKPKDESKK